MASEARYRGGCSCGAVRIEVHGEALRVGICHCLDCRKRQGAIFHSFAVFPADAVHVSGETRQFQSKHFCPTCGSPLFDRFGEELELHLGCLDEPSQLRPSYESWVIRREDWLPAFELEHHYPRDRDIS